MLLFEKKFWELQLLSPSVRVHVVLHKSEGDELTLFFLHTCHWSAVIVVNHFLTPYSDCWHTKGCSRMNWINCRTVWFPLPDNAVYNLRYRSTQKNISRVLFPNLHPLQQKKKHLCVCANAYDRLDAVMLFNLEIWSSLHYTVSQNIREKVFIFHEIWEQSGCSSWTVLRQW